MLISYMMEQALCETAQGCQWSKLPCLYPDLPYEDSLFMDDGLLWSRDVATLSRKLTEFSPVLQEFGIWPTVKPWEMQIVSLPI